MSMKFDSEPIYAGNDNYIKTRMKFFWDKIKQIFKVKKCQKKMHHISLCH